MNARRLPMLATVLQGWRLLARDWWVLLRIVALPLAVLVVLDVYLAALWNHRTAGSEISNLQYAQNELVALVNLDLVLALVLNGLVVAVWHRVRLTGRRRLSVFSLLAGWRNIVALAAHWCALILITIGLQRVFSSPLGLPVTNFLHWFLAEKAGLISYLTTYRVLLKLLLDGVPLFFALYVSGRLGLMLWARPRGRADALDRAWAAGAGNGWRLAAAIFLAILPIAIIESALPPMLGAAVDVQYIFLRHDIANLLQLIAAVAVIAVAHQSLMGDAAATETPAPADATSP